MKGSCMSMEKEYMTDGKMNFSCLYFHGLFFGRSDNSTYLEKLVLDKILKYGEIVPRNRLSEKLTDEEYSALFFSKPNYYFNGFDCVSLACKHDTYNDWNRKYVIQSDRAFPLYCAHNISIIISPKVVWDYNCYGPFRIYRDRENKFMNGEMQVKGTITKDYFQGISYYQNCTNSLIEEMLKDNSNNIVKEDLLKLSENTFLGKYFEKQIMIEELLSKYSYNTEIFNIKTGEKLPSIEEEKEILYTLKKALL